MLWVYFSGTFRVNGVREEKIMYAILIDGVVVPVEDIMDWALWFENTQNRVIRQTDVDEIFVSTVFIGIDNAFFRDGFHQWFETMVFGGKLDNQQWHYETLEEAIAGHNHVLELIGLGENHA